MDIWKKMYEYAKKEYHPQEVTPFIYTHHVVCALEAEDGQLFTGFCFESCCGVLDLCAERVAALNMYADSEQTVIKRIIFGTMFLMEFLVCLVVLVENYCSSFLLKMLIQKS